MSQTTETRVRNGPWTALPWQRLLENTPFAALMLVIWIVFVQPMQQEQQAIRSEIKELRKQLQAEMKDLRSLVFEERGKTR